MSLIKLFNFKFMKQILKKSKGQLMIFLLLVPIFTFLSLLVTFSGNSVGVIEHEITIINFIGMYVIPVILSINLFNYIYKRASVDFINSMPVNKKTIFCSNVLLGIILIIIMQSINALGIVLFSALKPELVLFGELIWDTFIMTTVSYIFVFTATNLAMCLSGNIITQIVMTCLIVFFVPFFVNNFNNNMFNIRTGNYVLKLDEVVLNGQENIGLTKLDAYNETMPYRLLKCIASSGINLYNSTSIIKMIVLSVIYTVIGTILFEKRKFENLGESFKDVKVHQIVKALTMFPMFALINKLQLLESDMEVILLVYALLIAYFIIYDVITSKKVKFKNTIVSVIAVFVVLNLITLGIDKNIKNREAKFYSLDDIKSVSIDLSGYRQYYSEILDYEITDENIIKMILKNNITIPSTVKVRLNDGNELFVDRTFTSLDKIDYDREKFIKEVCSDENYKQALIKSKLADGYYTLYNRTKVTGELEKEIDKLIKEYQKENVNIIDKYYDSESDYLFEITKYYYDNHMIMTEIYDINDTEIKEKIIKVYNKDMLKAIKDINEDEYAWINLFDPTIDRRAHFSTGQLDQITNIILKENDDYVDFNKRYLIVSYNASSSRKEYVYITDNENLYRLYLDKIKMDYNEYDYNYYKDLEFTIEDIEAIENEFENVVSTVN